MIIFPAISHSLSLPFCPASQKEGSKSGRFAKFICVCSGIYQELLHRFLCRLLQHFCSGSGDIWGCFRITGVVTAPSDLNPTKLEIINTTYFKISNLKISIVIKRNKSVNKLLNLNQNSSATRFPRCFSRTGFNTMYNLFVASIGIFSKYSLVVNTVKTKVTVISSWKQDLNVTSDENRIE